MRWTPPLLQHARGSQQDTKTNAQCNYLLIRATCRRPFMTLIPLALWVLASICFSVSVFADPPNPSCIDVCTKPSLGDCLSGVLTESSIVFWEINDLGDKDFTENKDLQGGWLNKVWYLLLIAVSKYFTALTLFLNH